MKFAFVGSRANLDLERIGGIESTMRELVFFLLRKKHIVHLLIIDNQNKEQKIISTEFGEIRIIIANIKGIRKEMITGFNVINFLQSPFNNPIYALYFALQKTFGKFITTKFFFTYPTLKNSTVLQNLKLKILIDETFVFSKRLERLAKQIVKNVTMIYPPVSDNFKNINNIENEKPKILFIGRLSKDKGLEVVKDIYSKLSRDKYSLTIMGYFANAKDKITYEHELQNLNLDYLKIVEHDAQNKTPFVLSDYDILLLPYQDLGPTLDTPLLILEGLSSGCKVVTSNLPPLNDITGNIYFVDKFKSSQSFIDKIGEVRDIKPKANYEDYSSETFGNKYLSSLRKKGLNV